MLIMFTFLLFGCKFKFKFIFIICKDINIFIYLSIIRFFFSIGICDYYNPLF